MNLYKEIKLGRHKLKNRVVLAPMTRARANDSTGVINESASKYYSQRASAGLLITEATQISQQGKGYSFTPGIYTEPQVSSWKKVTDEVHNNNGIIFSQLWHVGRMSHPSFHLDGKPVAPSAIKFDASVWIYNKEINEGEMIPCPVPRELSIEEIKDIVLDYGKAAKNAIKAGFDGVEIHGGNGYLIDQFLRSTSNKRNDEYGGSIQKRLRFVKEVLNEVVSKVGADKVGLRLAPFITQRGMNCPDALKSILKLAKYCNELGIAYIHLSEADWDDAPTVTTEFREELRKLFSGVIIVAGNYTKERGEETLTRGYADLIAYGRDFIANPNLIEKFKSNKTLEDFDNTTLFGGGDRGYIDYK